MTDKNPLPTYNWYVRFKLEREQEHSYLLAAYFQDEGTFFTFKDAHHKTIYTVAKSEVLDMGRKDPNSQ